MKDFNNIVLKSLANFYNGKTKKIICNTTNLNVKDGPFEAEIEGILCADDPTKNDVLYFMKNWLYYEDGFDNKILCSFGLVDLPILNNITNPSELVETIKYIIKNKVKFTGLYDLEKAKITKITFDKLLEPISAEYFENWADASIEVGCWFVRLCDYLGVKVKTLSNSPSDWDVEESEFEEYVNDKKTKDELKDFARLFKKPIKSWYPRKLNYY